MKVIDVYASSFYGSCLWNFFSGQCDTLYTAWNNAIREAFSLPKMTHRYLIEHISEHVHPKVMFCSRFLKFHTDLLKCHKPTIKYLCELSCHNKRTVYSQNLAGISRSVGCNVDQLTCNLIRKTMEYQSTPDNQKWRVAVVKDLLELRWNTLEINGWLEEDGLDSWLEYLTIS